MAIGVGGGIVGVLDLAYAIVVYTPTKPILVSQTIAGGILGTRAYDGGMRTAVLGTFLHFVIAFGAATVYYLASRKLAFLVDRAVLCGLVYGALVYSIMHTIVVPLSALPPFPPGPAMYQVCEFIEHWFCVGLPIALSVRRYAP